MQRGERFTLPEPVLRLAQAEYDRQYPGQPYERMQERGGLGLLEIVGLMADYIERIDPPSSDEQMQVDVPDSFDRSAE